MCRRVSRPGATPRLRRPATNAWYVRPTGSRERTRSHYVPLSGPRCWSGGSSHKTMREHESGGCMSARRDPYRADAPLAMLIGGDWVTSDDSFEAIDPRTGLPWASIPEAGPAQVNAAAEAARRARTPSFVAQTQRRVSLCALTGSAKSNSARLTSHDRHARAGRPRPSRYRSRRPV